MAFSFKNRRNKCINRYIVNMIFLELKILKMSINRQIWQLCSSFTFIIVVLCVCFVYIYSCSVVAVFLFTCLPVFFMLMFVVILSTTTICWQVCLVHCLVFVAFVYNFNGFRHLDSSFFKQYSIVNFVFVLITVEINKYIIRVANVK